SVRLQLDIRPEDEEFLTFLNALAAVLDDWFQVARGAIEDALTAATGAPAQEQVLKDAVRFYFDNFDRYDMVSHPILYATDAGDELDHVEVFRISPEDATSIVDEAETGKKKLFGTKLANFGAFFKRGFRTNDILWGRLDGAQRIITALLPEAKYDRKRCTPPSCQYDPTRDQLIEEAQNAILKEVLGVEDDSKLISILEHLAHSANPTQADGYGRGNGTERKFTSAAEENLDRYLTEPRVKFALTSFLRNRTPVQLFREQFIDQYETLRQFNSQDMVKDAARASKVFGKMLDGY